MTHEDFETLAAAHAVGALDGPDLARFEAHLATGCAACRETLRETAEALAAAAAADPPAVPPPAVKAALMARVAADGGGRGARPALTRPDPQALRRTWLRRAVGAAAALLVGAFLAGGYVAARYEARLGQVIREQQALREQLRREAASLQVRLAAYQGVVDLLRDPATRVVPLRGTGPAPEAIGRVVWNEATGGHVIVTRLPSPPPGQVYEAWTIAAGQPAPAGVFTVDERGGAVHALTAAPGPVEVFAVTLEPAGGVPRPTGPIVLASGK
jgi:anti-sigma-K factor RskA